LASTYNLDLLIKQTNKSSQLFKAIDDENPIHKFGLNMLWQNLMNLCPTFLLDHPQFHIRYSVFFAITIPVASRILQFTSLKSTDTLNFICFGLTLLFTTLINNRNIEKKQV
jgi:hypothetical protein